MTKGEDLRLAIFFFLLIVLLVGAAILVPDNMLTGNVLITDSCADGDCLEMCDYDQENTCGDEMTCCFTHWTSGVCAYPDECESVREYSLYQSLEVYQDSVREQPARIEARWQQFFFPLVLTLMVVVYFVLRRKSHD